MKLPSSAEAFTSAFVAGAAIAFISRRWEHLEPLAFPTTSAGFVLSERGSTSTNLTARTPGTSQPLEACSSALTSPVRCPPTRCEESCPLLFRIQLDVRWPASGDHLHSVLIRMQTEDGCIVAPVARRPLCRTTPQLQDRAEFHKPGGAHGRASRHEQEAVPLPCIYS